MQTSHNFTFTLQCCARYRNPLCTSLFPHSFKYSGNIQSSEHFTYKNKCLSRGSDFVRLHVLLKTNQWGSTHCKRKRTLDMLLCSESNCSTVFSLPLQVQYIVMDSVLSLLHSLSGSCSHPGSRNSASWLFPTPLQTPCSGQHNTREEGREARELWQPGWGMLVRAMLARLAATAKSFWKNGCLTPAAGYFFLLCCRRACSLCRAPDGFEPAPIEKEGVAGDPENRRQKNMTGLQISTSFVSVQYAY